MTRVEDVFVVEYGSKLDMNKMTKTERLKGVAFVGRIGGLNGKSGVSGFVEPIPGREPYPAGLLTVALGGSRLLSTYVQQLPFYTAQNVAVLTPRDESMPLNHRLYYAMCIKANAFRYSAFGREANRTLATVELPDEVPEWVDKSEVPTVEGLAGTSGPELDLGDEAEWSWFRYGTLFEVMKGRRVRKADRNPGGTRFIGASEKNNGITDMCDLEPRFQVHCLTVPYNGNSVGVAFYQDKPFFASDDVTVLRPRDEVSKWSLLFVAAVIRFERYRYTYGYKWGKARMTESVLRLPSTPDGEPDWGFMEAYMRGLPFSASV
ncbi:restriction endonuclease subunit S [Gordonia sp. MP11Mi]|uniref:Restriction enzyme BgcI subunit beta n=1 Tax=Gordonia sp. MP11Mi TaxID=3022769 RepID=A0AA97GW19_9ACTN